MTHQWFGFWDSHQTHERGEQTEDSLDICAFTGTDERSGCSLHLLLSSLFLLFQLKSQICADSCTFMKLWTNWTRERFWYDSMKKMTALTATATLWTVCTLCTGLYASVYLRTAQTGSAGSGRSGHGSRACWETRGGPNTWRTKTGVRLRDTQLKHTLGQIATCFKRVSKNRCECATSPHQQTNILLPPSGQRSAGGCGQCPGTRLMVRRTTTGVKHHISFFLTTFQNNNKNSWKVKEELCIRYIHSNKW